MVDQAVLDKLEAGFAKLQASDSKSLLKKHLTKEVFDALKTKKTSFGSTLLDCIQSGVENLDSGCGIYAPDAESYTVFADLFDPIIEEYHTGFKKSDKHPPKDFGDVDTLGNLDPSVSCCLVKFIDNVISDYVEVFFFFFNVRYECKAINTP